MISSDTGSEGETLTRAWALAVRTFFREGEAALAPFLAFYDEGIRFEDPFHCVVGISAFAEMNRRFLRSVREVDLELGDVVEGERAAFASWSMRLAPRLGPRLRVDGVSHLRIERGKIVQHRDHFDPLGSLADAAPLGGRIYRALGALTG